MRPERFAIVVIGALATSACAMGPLPTPQASIENLQAVRAAGIAPVALGDFVLAPGKPKSMDRTLTIRAGIVSAPGDGSFASYLRQTLSAELAAGGKLDAGSTIVISGELTRSDVDAGVSRGHAFLGARFIVTREGKVAYDKPLEVEADWDGDFLGAVAIPAAMNHYNALYPKLVGALLSDTEFKNAARKR
jgi:hypothetical protein